LRAVGIGIELLAQGNGGRETRDARRGTGHPAKLVVSVAVRTGDSGDTNRLRLFE
jgi:hypothetical protein